MNPNLHDVIIDRNPLQKAIRVETLRAELNDLGFTVVSTEWLQKKLVAEKIHGRKLEGVQ
jgi:hypothetical protein